MPPESSVLTSTTAVSASTLIASTAPESESAVHRVVPEGFGASLEVPVAWDADPERTEWSGHDGFVHVAAWGSDRESLDEFARQVAGHHLDPYGTTPTILEITVDGVAGRLIMPSIDSTTLQGLRFGEMLARAPAPIVLAGDSYGVLSIVADVAHIRDIVDSVRWE